ncbi:hypothetical protein OKA04_14900 [Luteolibacter flavescens]|uniref:Glycine zipper domain-containing protein n=1 Tax=Luteolibacter flavescens TaxID=1859460 RepID=A0ABT3FS47_9BACT|nr:hypothetical protein [Luteolibacter flavescens]MCW1886024.1 hypothetical protein [Luteolibacter flavescens]
MKSQDKEIRDARNEDPITGEPGSHPVAVGVGTAAGAAAGGAVGAIAGPVGAAVGAVVGGIAGAVSGKAGGEAVNPTVEEAYWRENHPRQSYAAADSSYDDYDPAYRMGWEGPTRYGTNFEAANSAMRSDWEERKGSSKLDWQDAEPAVRAGWERVDKKRGEDRGVL